MTLAKAFDVAGEFGPRHDARQGNRDVLAVRAFRGRLAVGDDLSPESSLQVMIERGRALLNG